MSAKVTRSGVGVIWAEVLGIERVFEPDDNFFELGGDSVLAMIMRFHIEQEFGIDLSAAAVVEAPTLSAFCALLERERELHLSCPGWDPRTPAT